MINFESKVGYSIRNIFISVICASFTLGTYFMIPIQLDANAITTLPGNFGGRVLESNVCSCTPGCILVLIGPPKGGVKMWCPTTLTFMFWTIGPFRWQLGLQGLMATCMEAATYYCYANGAGNIMLIDGTSLR